MWWWVYGEWVTNERKTSKPEEGTVDKPFDVVGYRYARNVQEVNEIEATKFAEWSAVEVRYPRYADWSDAWAAWQELKTHLVETETFDPTNQDTYTCDACGQEVYEELATDHDAYCVDGRGTVIGVVGGGSA